MLAGAGAFQCQGARDELVIQLFSNAPLLGNVRVNQIPKVKVAIADVADQKVRDACCINFGDRFQQAVLSI